MAIRRIAVRASSPQLESEMIEALNELKSYVLRSPLARHSRVDSSGSTRHGFHRSGNGFEFQIRDWGQWELPEDRDSDDDDDYDWNVLTRASRDAMNKMVDDAERRHPFSFYFSQEEKNWISVGVGPKSSKR
jgi:hypothetical protein